MLDLTVRTYDPGKVVVAFGASIITGFAEGTFISIARNGDIFEKSRGADGTVDRINKNANDFAVTMTLKQTSISNDDLSAYSLVDQISNSGKLPLSIKDLGGNTLFFAAQAWIAKDPDDEFSDSLSNREWRFDTGAAAKYSGGNTSLL